MTVTLITGEEPHYQIGLISGLVGNDFALEVVGGASIASATVVRESDVRFQDLQPALDPKGSRLVKLGQVLCYYARLMWYAARSRSCLLHIQWHYKFKFFDRTVLNLYYKALGKKLLFTAHNVDRSARDGGGNALERFSLKFHYRIVDHIIVHTEKMKSDLVDSFGVLSDKVSVIPHGLNSAVPETALGRDEARRRLKLPEGRKALLFFGLIDRYKGLDCLIEALANLEERGEVPFLMIAGKVKGDDDYWRKIEAAIDKHQLGKEILRDIRRIPDEEVEVYFKAADALVLPYRGIFQSGVLFLAFRFGLPVIASDVGSFSEDIFEGRTGALFNADDPEDLAKAIERYFQSGLYEGLEDNRSKIKEYALGRYSWSAIGKKTSALYSQILRY